MDDIELDLAAFTKGVRAAVPIMGAMGVRVVELRRGFAAAELPLEPNHDQVGTVHNGCIFSAAELLGGIIGFPSFDLDGYFPELKHLDGRLFRSARSAVRATASLSDEEIERIQAVAQERGKSEFTIDVDVTDADGARVASAQCTYSYRKFSG